MCRSDTYIKPIHSAAVDEGWEHAAPISESGTDGAHAQNDMEVLPN